MSANGSKPLEVWRCERCYAWKHRNGESAMPCQTCRWGKQHKPFPMTKAMRVEPEPFTPSRFDEL